MFKHRETRVFERPEGNTRNDKMSAPYETAREKQNVGYLNRLVKRREFSRCSMPFRIPYAVRDREGSSHSHKMRRVNTAPPNQKKKKKNMQPR